MKKLKLFRKIKSILSILLISLLIIPLCSGIGIHAKEKNTESNEYKIYPIPHSVVYDNEQFVMSDRVHVVFEEGIDKATQNFLEEVITDYGKTVVHSEEIVNGETTILLGIKGSNGKAFNKSSILYVRKILDLYAAKGWIFIRCKHHL